MLSLVTTIVSSIQKRRRICDRRLVATIVTFTTIVTSLYFSSNFDKLPQHTSRITGRKWIRELLIGHPQRIKNNLGVSQETFLALEDILIKKSTLRNTRRIGTKEQLGIFLYIVTSDISMRKPAERFQRSTETINRTYHKIMKHLLYPPFFESIVTLHIASIPLEDISQTIEPSFLSSRIILAQLMAYVFRLYLLNTNELSFEIAKAFCVKMFLLSVISTSSLQWL